MTPINDIIILFFLIAIKFLAEGTYRLIILTALLYGVPAGGTASNLPFLIP